jgi:hypothetical protein
MGDDTRGRPRAPTVVPGLSRITDLRANGNRTCALRTDQRVTCWGYVRTDGAQSAQPPAEVPGLNDATALYSADPLCVRHRDRRVTCQDENGSVELPAGATPSVAGPNSWCVADAAGAVRCTTSGNGKTTPVALPGKATSVSTSTQASCAVVEGGHVYCWGGEAGYGFEGSSDRSAQNPLHVPLGHPATTVAASETRRCALLSTGEVDCWGRPWVAKDTGTNAAQGPTPLPAPGRIEAIGMGEAHLCVVTNGAIYCMGNNDQGQLGGGRRSGATADWVEATRNAAPEPRAFEKLPGCAAAAGCRPRCGACPAQSLCASDGTCRSIRRETKQRKAKNGAVSWESLKWGDPEREKALNHFVADKAKSSWEEIGDEPADKTVECLVTYLSDVAAHVNCNEFYGYPGAGFPVSEDIGHTLDLRGAKPRTIDYEEVIPTASCREALHEYAYDSFLDQGIPSVVDGQPYDANREVALGREGLILGDYFQLPSQVYLAHVPVVVPCTVLRAVGCASPWIDDVCR